MRLDLTRYSECYLFGGSTFGNFYLNEKFACYTLEDEGREIKVPGETRIPAGEYRVILRMFGRHHEKCKILYPEIHMGMLEIAGVPGFTGILIHTGNTEQDTDGCIIVGDKPNNNQVEAAKLLDSVIAYKRIYVPISKAIASDEVVMLSVA